MCDRKLIFAVYLPLKPFRVTVASSDIESQKSLHTFLKTYLFHVLVKFEHNRTVRTTRVMSFLIKTGSIFFKTNFDKVLTPILEDVSAAETIV